MALQYLFDPNKQFQSTGGVNEVGGFLRVFFNGTDDRATTYRNFDGGMNEPDIVLDTYGRAVVIVDDTKTYRLEVYNRLGGLMWTVSNYKARGGSGGGSGTPVSVEGTVGEIDVDENTEGGVKHFVVGLATTIKNAIATLTMAVNGLANALNGKKDRQLPVSVSGGTTKTLVGISQDADGAMTPEFDDIDFPDYSQRFENIENEQSVDAKVIAAALNDLNARMEAVEDSQDEKNIGDRIADAFDSQKLSEGGIRVKVRQSVKNFFGSSTKTITNLSQDANGEFTATFDDIDFDSKVLSFYPQSLGNMTPDERAALNAKMQEVAYHGGIIILWERDFPSVLSYYSSSEYYFYRVEKYVNGIEYHESIVTYNGITKTFNVDQSLTTINPSLYEKVANKKTTITGNEASTTYYPTIKALVDYLDSRLQNLGGKKITNNGVPFTAASQLPTTTPYYGQNINSDDYAYVQDTGLASRYMATVTGSSVAWSLDYEIAIPVFTAEQQAAIDSSITSGKVSGYDSHVADTYIHVTASQKTEWSGKQDALSSAQMDAVNSGITSGKVSGYDSHIADTSIHVTASEKTTWNAKQDAIGDLAAIRSGAEAGATAVQPGDLADVATSGSYSDLSGTPTIPTKTSQLTNDSDFTTNAALTTGLAMKQDTISDLATIRSGAAAGSTALQPTGNGSNVTSTFSEALTRSNIVSGESLSTIFGKIKKFFSDLKAVAFSGSYADLSGTPEIPEAATATPKPVSASDGSTGSSPYFAKGDHVHKIVVGEGVNDGQISIAGESVSVKGWDTIYQNYMQTSSGTKSLSFGSMTTIGSVNGSNVVLSMPQANFISKDLDLATGFSLSVCQFVCHESVPPSGTWHRYDGTDVCNAFETKIGLDWGISSTNYGGTANKATNDGLGNNIVSTYATKQELSDTATGLGGSIASAVTGIYDSMNRGCVRSAFDYESITGKFTDVFSVKRESTSYVDAVVRLKVWGKYQYISATNDHTFCADITVQLRGESGSSNWTSAIADGCIIYKGSTSSVSDLRVKMTTDSENRLYISILAANATEPYTRMIVESNFMTNNTERCSFSNAVSIYGSVPAGRSALGAEFSLT